MDDDESKDELYACPRCREGCRAIVKYLSGRLRAALTTKAASRSPSNLPLNPCRLAGLRNIAALPATP
jgi:hypothetical protein